MYLGEIVRRVLLKLSLQSALFGEIDHIKLKTHFHLRYVVWLAFHIWCSNVYVIIKNVILFP
jgi:hexokinase